MADGGSIPPASTNIRACDHTGRPDGHRPFSLHWQGPIISSSNDKTQRKNIDHLPPLLRSQALHTRLPRNRRLPWVGIAATVLLHLVILAVLYVNRGKMPESVFFPKLFPLDEKAVPRHDDAAPEAAAPQPAPAVQPEPTPAP